MFQVHWSSVPREDAAGLIGDGCRLLAIWPAPVNHDRCFEEAGFTLFGDNDEAWDQEADKLLCRVIEELSGFGPAELVSKPLTTKPPWYLRLFQPRTELPLQEQASLPMEWDSLPPFHARFGDEGAALRTGNGHVLLWISLPAAEPALAGFVARVAEPWTIVQTSLRWEPLLSWNGAPVDNESGRMTVSGTIQYSQQDLALSQSAFTQGQPMPLWKGACVIACLGAVIGFGLATLLAAMLEPVMPELSQYAVWGATAGSILLVSAGAWRLSAKASPMQAAAMRQPQTFRLDEDGFSLSTATAETRMSWAHFVAARIEPDSMILKTQDETIVLLRPDFFDDETAWNEARRIIGGKIATT